MKRSTLGLILLVAFAGCGGSDDTTSVKTETVTKTLVKTETVSPSLGGETTDVSKPVEELNASLKDTDTQLDCPDEVPGGKGAVFNCTFEGPGGKFDTTLVVKEEGDDLTVDGQNQKEFQAALEKAIGE